jgi:multiple sugar transport system substrate-binding protein
MLRNLLLARLVGAAVVVMVVGTACSTGSSNTSTSLRGQTVTVWTANREVLSGKIKPLLASFESQTGIKVDFVEIPDAGYVQKLKLSLTAKDSSFDVYELEGGPLLSGYIAQGGAEPIDAYLNDPNKTPASWDAQDIPAGLMNNCTIEGKHYCLPMFASATFLYYNKEIFAQAGLTGPPQTIQELVQDAQKTNSAAHAGICMRGTPDSANFYTGYMLGGYFLPYNAANKGMLIDSTWNPVLTSAPALEWARTYSTLMRQYGPKGVASYSYLECNTDFEQGRAAMYLECNCWPGEFLDKTKSKVADKVGFAVVPCPPTNPNSCIMNAMAGWMINKNSKKKDAAWEVMKFLVAKQTLTDYIAAGKFYLGAVRTSVINSVYSGPGFPSDLSSAMQYALTHLYPGPEPQIPETSELDSALGVAFSKITSGQSTPEAAFAEANAAMIKTLKQGGYLTG